MTEDTQVDSSECKPLPGSNVLIWSNRHSWLRVVHQFFAESHNQRIAEEVLRARPQDLVDSNLTWLRRAESSVGLTSEASLQERFSRVLSSRFAFIYGFHGTRAELPTEFLDGGLRLSDINALRERAVRQFGDELLVNTAVLDLRRSGYESHNAGKIFLSLTKKSCLYDYPEYMTRGSEYLSCIASRIRPGFPYSPPGLPMLVECLVPSKCLDPELDFWMGRSRVMIEEYFLNRLRADKSWPLRSSCITCTKAIPRECVVQVHQYTEVQKVTRWKSCASMGFSYGKIVRLRRTRSWPGLCHSSAHRANLN